MIEPDPEGHMIRIGPTPLEEVTLAGQFEEDEGLAHISALGMEVVEACTGQ